MKKKVFKCGSKPTGGNVDLIEACASANIFYYDYNMTSPFMNAKVGDLVVLHTGGGKLFKYVGEISVAPFYPLMANVSANKYPKDVTDFFNRKISTSDASKKHIGKCVMGCVTKFYKIDTYGLTHGVRGSRGACQVRQANVCDAVRSAYKEVSTANGQ